MKDLSNENQSRDEIFRGYAWSYFSQHATQRMSAFHFYILLSSALIGGFALSYKNAGIQKWMSIFGALLSFFSFVFWKLDERTKALVKNGENAIKFLDAQHNLPDMEGLPHPLRLFSREEAECEQLKPQSFMRGYFKFSYARCFRWVFGMFFWVGVAVGVICFLFA